MEIRRQTPWLGERIVRSRHPSRVLAGNPWNDPSERELLAYLPPGYHDDDRRYPVLWYLAAYTNSGLGAANWRGFGENHFERIERLIRAGRMAPAIVVAPDCFTSLGGNQYLNSPALGAYADYIHEELVPLVDERFRTLAAREHRGLFGKSSGGYGALRLAMERPDCWGALADHSGDVDFEWVYRHDMPKVAAVLRGHDGDPLKFLRHFWTTESRTGDDFTTLMFLCMAASYAPEPETECGFVLPFDLETLEIDQYRWRRWLVHDPLNLVAAHAEALKSMRAIFIDCGNRDEYHLHYGARRLSRRLDQLGVAHRYEEFDGTHSGIDHRLEVSLPLLSQALSDD